MTDLRFRRAIPTATPDPNRPSWCEADETAAVGTITVRPYARQHETTPGHRVVLPGVLKLPLVNGEVTLANAEPGHLIIKEDGIAQGRRDGWIVLVPDVAGIVDDCDLPAIDPATLTPEAAPEAAWWTALQAVIDAVHDHDDRYYTEAESDGRYATGSTAVVDLCAPPYNLAPGDDCTAALQAALTRAGQRVESTDIWFSRQGTYTLNGPRQTGTVLGYTYSGQVLVPPVQETDAIAIRIRGAAPVSPGGSARPPGGTRIVSNATTGWMIDCIPSFTAYGASEPWTNVWFALEDLVFEGPQNPQCGGINAWCTSSFSTRRVAVTVPVPELDVTTRTGTLEAIRPSQDLNEFNIVLDQTVVLGWPVGITLTEHMTLRDVRTTMCTRAFKCTDGSHYNLFEHVSVENTPTVFWMPSNSGSALMVYGSMSCEWPNVEPANFAEIWNHGQITGELAIEVHGAVKGGLPIDKQLYYTTAGQGDNMFNLANLGQVGVRSWGSMHPRDNFQRVYNPVLNKIGLSWPTLHPWWRRSGSMLVESTAPGQPGWLRATEAWSAAAWIPALDGKTGSVSRAIHGKFTLGASSPRVYLYGDMIVGGTYNYHGFLFDVSPSGASIKIDVDGTVIVNNPTAGLVAANGSYQLTLEVIHNAMGYPTHVRGWINGVVACEADVPAEKQARFRSGTVAPFLADGVGLIDIASKCTEFWVTDV